MSGFDLYGDKSVENLAALPRTQVADPGFGEGFFRGTGMAIMREAFAKPARSMSMLGAVAPIAVDAITGGTTLQDKYFRTHQDVVDNAVKFWTPQPGEVGTAAELTGGLIGTLGQIVLSPHLAVSNQILSQGEDLVTQPGVSAGQALAVGIAQGAGLGVGIWAPPALGYNLVTKAATGAGVNLLQGIMTRGASAAILGDNPAARNFPAFGGEEMLFDVLLGAAFGTAAHYVPRWKAETENATTRLDIAARGPGKSPAEAALRPGARAVQEAINVWSQNVTPTEQAALATMRVAKHLNADSMPGRPTGPASVEVHVAAMREAIQSLLTDQPVTARVTNDDGSPIQREPTQPATRDMLAQARQELEQGQPGAGYQELLDIMAEPPGPRRAELLGNLRPDLAQAKEAPADPEQASLWAEIHQPDPAAKPTPIADLEAAVRSWNPESPVFHVKQPPLFTPEQTAGAEARLTALEQEAARIAAQEGLPGKPMDPIDTWVEREVRQAGRPPEESQAAGAMWKAAFESFGKAAGVDPTQLFYRYMDRVIGYGAAQPDAATTLMQAGTRPANNIEAYAPHVIPSQRNRIPQFRARDIAMIKPDMMLSSASKGKRASWLIYSVDANNKATKVGYVIADYNPADNTFHALRRIEVDDSLRGTGIGERTIAMMLRQNNGKPMEVHDIVHAGVQGTKDDALPFWKKLGIRLDNYSSNPDIQMDGRMTLADYLGARGGQGLREGRAGDAAQAVPPDGAGSRGGGAGAGGGDAGRLLQRPIGKPVDAAAVRDVAERHKNKQGDVTVATANRLAKAGHPDAGPVALAAYVADDFMAITGDKKAETPAAKALIKYLDEAQKSSTGTLYRVLGFATEAERDAFVKNMETSPTGALRQERPVQSWTTDSPEGKTPMTHIGLDQASIQGDYTVTVRIVPPVGDSTMRVGVDVSKMYGDQTKPGADVLTTKNAKFTYLSTDGDTITIMPGSEFQAGGRLFQSPTGRWYYSALSAAIDAAPPRAQNAGTWKQWLQAQINAGRIKETEVEWSGIRDYLDTQEGKISPDQLRAYMEQGGVRVEEVELGGRMDGMDRAVNDYEARTGRQAQDENGDWSEEFETSPEGRRFLKASEQSNQPRFATYQLPGAKPGSYRELALTLPRKPGPNALSVLEAAGLSPIRTGQNLYVMDRNGVRVNALDAHPDLRDPNGRDATPQEQAAIEKARFYEANPGGNFEVPPGHRMGPDADTNRIAHIRFNERTTSDGKRVLFIEEIQSDWAQKGRDNGWQNSQTFDVRRIDGSFIRRGFGTQEAALAYLEEARREGWAYAANTAQVVAGMPDGRGVPRAPFVEKTDAWVGLVMKRMIRYAAENGFDQVAWTRGDQQVERYASALRKQVDLIEWTKTKEGVQLVGYKGPPMRKPDEAELARWRSELAERERTRERMIAELGDPRDMAPMYRTAYQSVVDDITRINNEFARIESQAKGRQVVDTTQKETALSDAIGKTMAKQILEDPNQSGTIEGDAITIDDTGMAGFYDRIVPNVAKEVLRKLGGGQIRETEFTVDGEPEAQQAFDITPEVKAKAMQAQALFQRAGHMSPHTFDQFDHSHIGRGEGAQVYGWGTYLWTNRAVGDWYYNNFEREARNKATIHIFNGPFADAYIDPKGFMTAEARKLFTEPQRTAIQFFRDMIKEDGKLPNDAMRDTLNRLADTYGSDTEVYRDVHRWFVEQVNKPNTVRTIGVNDDPAYKTPDGRMVHASMQGAAKSLADALSQVESYGYERAAQTFDNLIRQAAEHARNQIEDLQRYVDATQRDIDTPMTARKVADTQYAVSFEHQPGKPRRAAIGITAADEVEAVLKVKQYLEKEHNDAKARIMEQTRRLNERVDELQITRQMVDEITEPLTYKLKHSGGLWWVEDSHGKVASHKQPSKADTQRYLEYLKTSADRALKPGYEQVKPAIKKPRHYTVEAPENDILIDWSKKVSEQPKPVLEALERGGIKVITEKEVTATARDLWEMDRSILEQRVNESTSDAEREDARADMLAQAGEDSREYKDRATEFLLDDYSSREDYSFGVLENESGRVLYTSMMEQFGYRSGPLDGPNTQYAAQASEAFAKMGIPGHRYLDGSSRRRGEGTYNLVIYDDKAMQIVHMEQTRERGFLQIGDQRKMLIGLGKDADASTFMHESAHFFLEVMDDLSTTVPALKADMEVLFTEWGIDRAAWDQMDLNSKRPYHEMFAESFEVYLMTNKAPTPELRSVFQRFRDWLLDIYQVATATGRKVSQPMRDLFDRMLDAQRRETTTTQAAQPTEGTPPPPRPEGGEPPGVVDPFDFETTGEPQPPAPLTLDDQGMREMIREAVEKESGWYQIGGRHMGGEHGVPNFSEWIPNGPWWVARPDKKLNAQGYINAVAKALVGDKLKPIEQRAVQYLLDHLNQRRVDEWKAARQEWDQLSAEVAAEGLQPTPENVIDANTVARAAAIDEAMVERLAMQYDGDDVGFMAEIRRMIDAQQNPATVQGGEGSPAAAPETAQAAAVADGRGDGQPAAGRQPDAAREAADDPLAREADRVAVENPAMVLQFDQPDGTVVRMTAAQYLEQVRMEAELARQDVSLLDVAAECMLGARS